MACAVPAKVEDATAQEAEIRRKEEIETNLVLSYGIFMTAVTMVVPTRAPMVLGIQRGDAAATARTMGLMSSCAAVLELFLNPVFGRLSDKFGRKPFLLFAPTLDAFLHVLVGAFPQSLKVNFLDRMITGSMIFSFIAPVNAALVDLWGAGEHLVPRLARAQMFFGVGAAIGPFIGSKLGGARSFQASAVMFLATTAWLWHKFPETLLPENKKEFDLAACTPWRFLRLFKDKTTATLATTIGLQSFGDYINIYDINFLYLRTVMDFGQAQVGNFATCVGLSQIVNGKFMKTLSQEVGGKKATLISNIAWILAMGCLGTSRTVFKLGLALLLMAGGHQRATAVSSYLQVAGKDIGMGSAEIEGAKANFTAVLKVFVPILYGNLFAFFTSKGRNFPGAPYFLIAALTAMSQVTFSTVPNK